MDKVLIIEDSRVVARILQQTIEKRLGLEVEIAACLADARALVSSNPERFFLAVVDLKLPDAPKGEALNEMKLHNIASIVFTGTLDEETRQKILAEGVVDYIYKSNRNEMGYLSRLIDRIHRNRDIKVLVVDDSLAMRIVLRRLLAIHQFQVLEASTPSEALAILEKERGIRLVTVDYHMPEMNGAELVTAIRRVHGREELAILGIAGNTGVGQLSVQLLKAGANDYLSKPFVNEEFYCRIMQNLEVIERNRELAGANRKILALNEKLKKENLRMGAELEITRRLQEMVLPTQAELKQVKSLDIAGYMEPADEVGGDYYDVFQTGNSINIAIGDVTGHGLESGMVMLMTQTAVRTLINAGINEPAQLMDVLNRTICDNVQRMNTDKSLSLCLIDYQQGQVVLSGQHEELIVVRRHGAIERLDTIDLGFPIGLDDDIAEYIGKAQISLETGDGIVLYTDGITEAENPAGEQYGMDRLCNILQIQWNADAESVKQAVIDDVRNFMEGQKVYDDISLLVLKQC